MVLGQTGLYDPRFRKAFSAPSSSQLQLIQTNHIQWFDKNLVLARVGVGVPKTTIFELAHHELFVTSEEHSYLRDHSFQSLIVALAIRLAAPRSQLAFRFARSRHIAVIALGLPRCTLAISQPIA